jgi:hypothetical protein
MPEYIELGLVETTRSPADFAAMGYESLTANVPGWDPTNGKLEARLIDAIALMASELAILIGAVPAAIFRYFGKSILELPAIDESYATIDAIVTASSTAGWTLAEGSAWGLRTAGDTLVAFRTTGELVIPPGDWTGTVTLQAVDPGAEASGLSGTFEAIDAVTWVASMVGVGVSTGGVDAESDLDYQDRLREELTTLAPREILPRDVEIFARRIAGVDRALAIDLLNPNDGTTNNARMVTVAVRDAAGEPVSTLTKNAVQADLAAKREANFVFWVIDPAYTTIDVVFSAVAFADFDAAVVEADAVDAVTGYLSPKDWGQPPDDRSHQWHQVTTVRYLEVAGVLDRVAGLDYVQSLLIGKRVAATGVASTDVITSTAHGFTANQPVVFSSLTGGAGLTAGTVYYARDITTNTFKVSATAGGSAVNVTSDMSAGFVAGLSTSNITMSGYAPLPRPGVVDGTVTAP